jgi:hypothetical protein
MSKKSRRRNKKILSALAVLGTGLALANRGKGTGVSGSDKAKFTSDAAYRMPKVKENEFKEIIVTTPKTIKDSQVLGRMRGSGEEGGFRGQRKRANYVQRAKDAAAADAMRAFRSNNAYRGNMMTAPRIEEFKTSDFDYFSKGGKVTKRKGAAKRGFGRAFKGGK